MRLRARSTPAEQSISGAAQTTLLGAGRVTVGPALQSPTPTRNVPHPLNNLQSSLPLLPAASFYFLDEASNMSTAATIRIDYSTINRAAINRAN
jgi:hypothetical protein